MKLISLNIWGGHELDSLLSFLREHREKTDIFCFQEVWSYSEPLTSNGIRLNVLEELSALLSGHQAFFDPIQDRIDAKGNIDIPSVYGRVTFVKAGLPVGQRGFIFTSGGHNTYSGDDWNVMGHGFQYLEIEVGGRSLTIINFHGLSRPGNKLDSPERIAQSKKILDFLKSVTGAKIVCGDFNLMPNTESIRILEGGMSNLVKTFDIQDVRGDLNARLHPENPQRFASYMFISPEIIINSFEVPNVSVSDHLPLVLQFSY